MLNVYHNQLVKVLRKQTVDSTAQPSEHLFVLPSGAFSFLNHFKLPYAAILLQGFPIIHLLNGVYNLREYTGSVIPKFSANNKNIFIICCTKNTKPLGGF